MTESVWGPAHEDMCALLTRHPDDVPAVVRQLTDLQGVLDRVPPLLAANPLADFNRLYLAITTDVLERLYEGRFADPQFLARLDVEFAARYFDALRGFHEGSTGCPRVWHVLFSRLAGPDRHPRPSAAGVHAHLHFDLPFALVTTLDHLGSDPVDDNDQHRDYLQITDLFAASVAGSRRGRPQEWQLVLDTMNGDLDDRWPGEVAAYTRNIGWRTAQRLWSTRHDQLGTAKERERLDGNAAALARLLVSPLGAFLH